MKKISNATVYLKSLTEEERSTLTLKVERTAMGYLLDRIPGEKVTVDTICSDLGFDLAQRQILNGLLKRLSASSFGKLILGRKGHPTSFVCWEGRVEELKVMTERDVEHSDTVGIAVSVAIRRLLLAVHHLQEILVYSRDSIPISDYQPVPSGIIGKES